MDCRKRGNRINSEGLNRVLARKAGRKLIAEAKQKGKQAFIYINNRLEGNALETVSAMVGELDG